VTPDRIVVTGIDGALLDPLTRDYDPARPAVEVLARLGVPLVLCSGRTRAEVTFVARIFGVGDAPIIVENGAVLLVPEGHLQGGVPGGELDGGWYVLRLGPPREQLLCALRGIATAAGVQVRLLSDLTSGERPRRPLPGSPLGLVPVPREHTEPFLLEREEDAAALGREAEARGLRLARGQSFWHLSGGADKGLAVRTLLSLYEREGRPPEAIGFGTWPMDLPMLRSVSRPIVLPVAEGRLDPELAEGLPGAERAWQAGPRGWNDAVLSALSQRTLPRVAAVVPRRERRPPDVRRAAN
jgi:mannosyl-3-phosphoglycerate phosphatase family protein